LASEGDLIKASRGLGRAKGIIRPYPRALKMAIGKLVTEAAIQVGDINTASENLKALVAENPTLAEKAELDYIEGRLKELGGVSNEYGKLCGGRDPEDLSGHRRLVAVHTITGVQGGYTMRKLFAFLVTGLLLVAALPTSAAAAETAAIHFGGFWVQSGIFKSFGNNSKAVYEAFIEDLESRGGVKLKDGRIGKIETTFYDSACNAEQALAVVRKMATQDKLLLAVGPSCSSALEPVFGIMQKKLDDPSDTGLQFMVFSDTSAKPGLGKISPWGFRASPDESAMYLDVMKHLKAIGVKSIAFGFEDDFAHSTATYKVMRKHALANGLEVLTDQGWRNTDTEFSTHISNSSALRH